MGDACSSRRGSADVVTPASPMRETELSPTSPPRRLLWTSTVSPSHPSAHDRLAVSCASPSLPVQALSRSSRAGVCPRDGNGVAREDGSPTRPGLNSDWRTTTYHGQSIRRYLLVLQGESASGTSGRFAHFAAFWRTDVPLVFLRLGGRGDHAPSRRASHDAQLGTGFGQASRVLRGRGAPARSAPSTRRSTPA
jgi:hypothetical protein